MAKKRKKRIGTRKKRLKGLPFAAVLLLIAGLSVWLFFFLSHSTERNILPAYEEIYSKDSQLYREMVKIDNAVYKVLYSRGIPEKDIVFLSVKPKHRQGYDWDFTELEVKLPEKTSVFNLGEEICEAISRLMPAVTVERKKVSDGEVYCTVFALGLSTHKIRLLCKDESSTVRRNSCSVAIVVDDLGYDAEVGRGFIRLDLPLSLSFLPIAPNTAVLVREAREKKRECMLHLPMEPNYFPRLNPGPGALMTNMDDREIREILGQHLQKIPGARGVNNHMGSYFTQRKDKMKVVLNEVKCRRLFFLDSRTTAKTVAFETAKEMGIPAAKRDVFLDNENATKAIRFQMERLLGMARHSGSGIGICHPNRRTLHVLEEYIPRMKKNFNVVPVSELTRRK